MKRQIYIRKEYFVIDGEQNKEPCLTWYLFYVTRDNETVVFASTMLEFIIKESAKEDDALLGRYLFDEHWASHSIVPQACKAELKKFLTVDWEISQ